jgi:RNA polymerase sigma-70 factor (ECF subfamily)
VDRVEEQRLLQAARGGDRDAFAMLYRANVQTIYRYIAYRVNDTQLAEDLTGDVFIRALQSMASYKDQGKPFKAWLYRIAHARVVDHYRRTDRRPNQSDIEDEPLATHHDMDGNMMRKQAASALKLAIAELTIEQQQVIILRFIEGYKIDDVAQMVNKKSNAVKALQHRALKAMASKLERSGFKIDEILSGLS